MTGVDTAGGAGAGAGAGGAADGGGGGGGAGAGAVIRLGSTTDISDRFPHAFGTTNVNVRPSLVTLNRNALNG